jgi:hypothetical protein
MLRHIMPMSRKICTFFVRLAICTGGAYTFTRVPYPTPFFSHLGIQEYAAYLRFILERGFSFSGSQNVKLHRCVRHESAHRTRVRLADSFSPRLVFCHLCEPSGTYLFFWESLMIVSNSFFVSGVIDRRIYFQSSKSESAFVSFISSRVIMRGNFVTNFTSTIIQVGFSFFDLRSTYVDCLSNCVKSG